ncbi:MAG TPA: hypothetical protein VFF17_07875 [Thermoanaerobaculia bacterium]|nr:hypothetical protein [Thermoanaerobaculia bacterium]
MDRAETYRIARDDYTFVLDREGVVAVKALPDFEGREEPAVVEEFLRARAEAWSEALASAGAERGEYTVIVDAHQGKAHLSHGGTLIVSEDL